MAFYINQTSSFETLVLLLARMNWEGMIGDGEPKKHIAPFVRSDDQRGKQTSSCIPDGALPACKQRTEQEQGGGYRCFHTRPCVTA